MKAGLASRPQKHANNGPSWGSLGHYFLDVWSPAHDCCMVGLRVFCGWLRCVLLGRFGLLQGMDSHGMPGSRMLIPSP